MCRTVNDVCNYSNDTFESSANHVYSIKELVTYNDICFVRAHFAHVQMTSMGRDVTRS